MTDLATKSTSEPAARQAGEPFDPALAHASGGAGVSSFDLRNPPTPIQSGATGEAKRRVRVAHKLPGGRGMRQQRGGSNADLPHSMADTLAVPHEKGSTEQNGAGSSTGQPLTRQPVDFAELPDGTSLELIRGDAGNSSAACPRFLVWNKGVAAAVDYFEHDGRMLVPPLLPDSLLGKIRLPDRAEDCPTAAKLYAELEDWIQRYIDLPFRSTPIVAAFALSTWFTDRLTVAPYLSICGPTGSGKTTLLRLLHCVCRRPVLLAGTIPPSLYSLLPSMHPTLLLDEVRYNGSESCNTTLCWLRAGNAHGVSVSIGGRLVEPFAPKVLCSRLPIADLALSSRALHISMIATTRELEPLSEAALDEIAANFQNRLLMLRLRTLRHLDSKTAEAACEGSSPRVRDLMFALMLPLVGDRRVIRLLKQALQDQQEYARVERALDRDGLVASALAFYCHRPGLSKIHVGHITASINDGRKRAKEEESFSAKSIGSVFKSFGLQTKKLSAAGRGIELTWENRIRIHEIMRSYGIPLEYKECEECSVLNDLATQSK